MFYVVKLHIPCLSAFLFCFSVLPSGLSCLQRGFPCNRGTGRYSEFAIKCGGPQITSSNGIKYERDNETLGPATYYVFDTDRWAVSNVGYFSGTNSPTYTSSSSSQFTNTLDSELFQTARLSASSLRYYGLGLENGNYTVSLQFAEIAFVNSQSWKSLGRRIFDIYIQGNLVLKDFDIQKDAGGASFVAVQKEYKNVQVSENYLEIHLFWAGKGTCCVPAQGTYGPSISAISATPEFTPTVSNIPPSTSSNKNRTGLIVGVVVGVGVLSFLAVFLVFYILRRRKPPTNDDEGKPKIMLHIHDSCQTSFSFLNIIEKWNSFLYVMLWYSLLMTSEGTLNDGRVIAVKQLSVTSHQGKNQFLTEIATISAVQHRNLVKLYGCCIEGDKRLLVYEYLENKSLDQALFGKRTLNLDWSTRFDICLGVARGLAYLHEESRLRIVHRDVKASNILLDSDLIPKISDFGLAKLYDDKKTHISTRVAGTIGYLAPEYAMRGHLTEKADVFAFGVVALELVSGRPNSDSSLEEEKIYLLEWAWQLHENNREVDLADSKLSEFNEEEVKQLIGVSLLCTQASPTLRPSMSRVVAMLSGDIEVSTVTSRPGYLTDWKYDDITSVTSEDAIDTTYFKSSSASTSMVGDVGNSPADASKPLVVDTIEQGR
ncbi:putative lrr receptor-like serine/threonine-protein kinase [Quercus suber]|uniref:non-specific serine/threonine protein kinase n=1 Tax=Quercus suber TaxID=58331 RepID=A0AAW0LJ06_QUESU